MKLSVESGFVQEKIQKLFDCISLVGKIYIYIKDKFLLKHKQIM